MRRLECDAVGCLQEAGGVPRDLKCRHEQGWSGPRLCRLPYGSCVERGGKMPESFRWDDGVTLVPLKQLVLPTETCSGGLHQGWDWEGSRLEEDSYSRHGKVRRFRLFRGQVDRNGPWFSAGMWGRSLICVLNSSWIWAHLLTVWSHRKRSTFLGGRLSIYYLSCCHLSVHIYICIWMHTNIK